MSSWPWRHCCGVRWHTSAMVRSSGRSRQIQIRHRPNDVAPSHADSAQRGSLTVSTQHRSEVHSGRLGDSRDNSSVHLISSFPTSFDRVVPAAEAKVDLHISLTSLQDGQRRIKRTSWLAWVCTLPSAPPSISLVMTRKRYFGAGS